MNLYIDKKLAKGLIKLEESDLSEEQINLLEIIHLHGSVPELVYKMFFDGAYDFPSEENSRRWSVINQMDKAGFILRHFVPKDDTSRLTVEKYEIHPDTYQHLQSKYPDYFSDGDRYPKHVLSLGLDHRGDVRFQAPFIPSKDILLEANSKYLAHLVLKRGRAILEIKKWS